MQSPYPSVLERRAASRTTSHTKVHLGSERHEVPVRDVTRQGLCFILNHVLQPGTVVYVEVHDPASDGISLIESRVVHCTQQPNDGWFIGTRFRHPLTVSDLQTILSVSAAIDLYR